MVRLLTTTLLMLAFVSTADAGNAFFKLRSSLHRRNNGALMSATVSVDKKTGSNIIIGWKIDYTGPRQPFTILKPSIRLTTFGQTVVVFYADGKEYNLRSPATAGKYASRPSWFVTVKKNGHANGELRVPVKRLRTFFLKRWPQSFDQNNPPVIRVQLIHTPHDRGAGNVLDAWTGSVHMLELKKW